METVQGPFGDCKNAILQSMGNVQSNGALVAINSASDLIEYCSANSAEVLGIEPAQLLGKTGPEWLATKWPSLSVLASGEGSLQWSDFPGRDPVTVVGHKQGAHRILEFERGWTTRKHWWNHASRTCFVEKLTTLHTVEQCREFLVGSVFEHSGYDRVMMYRFLPNWNGEVVNERCRPRVEGFLGLRFPASDIPANARQMFTLNWQRAIMDVDSDATPILKWNEDAQQLDLTYSTLRSAHPAHIQYLKNMGVQASLTLSMVVSGKLWGLIACHHLSARTPPIQDRLAFAEMARIVTLHLTNLLGLIELRLQSQLRQQLSRLQGVMSTIGEDARLALLSNLGMIRQTFSSGGAWLRFEGEDFFAGLVPDKLSLAPMRDLLDLLPREQVSHYHAIPESLQSYRALQANASGVLFIPLGSTDFIALMRPEVIETINWAGKREASEDSQGLVALPLTPRNSFAVWSEQVRNTSEPWIAIELEFGEKLRMDLELFLLTARLEFARVSRDITARKQAEARAKELAEAELRSAELARSNAELQQFAAVASHDLQEPLRMILIYMQLLSRRFKGKLDADADEYIGFALDASVRMKALIDALLAYSKVGGTSLELHEIPSEKSLHSALVNLRGVIVDSRALVTHDALPAVMADEMQLTQLFQNLVGNAIKYQKGTTPKIHVSAAANGDGRWNFSVHDNGIGIDPQYFEKVFGIFQRLHSRQEYAGTGIGLSICKRIVERHGGEISIESQPGQGSTFRFSLAGVPTCS